LAKAPRMQGRLARASRPSSDTRPTRLRRQLDGTVPFIAWIAENNLPSRRVAEPLALTSYGLAVDQSDSQLRLAYADRPVDGFSGQVSD
jgi:hypothetical protein